MRALLVAALLLLAIGTGAVERIDLTTPITKPIITTVRIGQVVLNYDLGTVYFYWLNSDGTPGSVVYGATPAPVSGRTGRQVLTLMNTGDFTTISLAKRFLQLLQQDGYLPAGSITGTPE